MQKLQPVYQASYAAADVDFVAMVTTTTITITDSRPSVSQSQPIKNFFSDAVDSRAVPEANQDNTSLPECLLLRTRPIGLIT